MITHTPLLREARSLFRSVGPATVPGPERQGTKQRFWSLGKELISTPPDVQGEEGNSPWLSVSWQRALGKVLWRPSSSFLPHSAVLVVVRQLPY